MNPDVAELEPKDNLPKPTPKAGELLSMPQKEAGKHLAEKQSGQIELPSSGVPGPGPGTQPQTPPISMQAPPIASSSPPTRVHVTDAPSDAEDADLIEKEWVIKAKAIVEQTRDDPHAQNKEISKFKADYMKKRYNKDLKVAEE